MPPLALFRGRRRRASRSHPSRTAPAYPALAVSPRRTACTPAQAVAPRPGITSMASARSGLVAGWRYQPCATPRPCPKALQSTPRAPTEKRSPQRQAHPATPPRSSRQPGARRRAVLSARPEGAVAPRAQAGRTSASRSLFVLPLDHVADQLVHVARARRHAHPFAVEVDDPSACRSSSARSIASGARSCRYSCSTCKTMARFRHPNRPLIGPGVLIGHLRFLLVVEAPRTALGERGTQPVSVGCLPCRGGQLSVPGSRAIHSSCGPSQQPSTYRSQSWAPRSKRRTPPRRRCRDVSARHPSHRPHTATLAERSSDSRNQALR
jgi:hypothetical protein